ncbi:beta-aspartyl-peptidase [Alteribacter natronophilus]|uniref:beta-aspartyl-peptidase n=1 Tax=Alteribacter natronophilus TaxID=2583810 RepID=UPI00110F05C1|nr:beta-aspartyl-peptidase [Alteribacter natronophilus]TMW71540.1 beta-aspartyl-peptidase [Alteribacter natronophilus]
MLKLIKNAEVYAPEPLGKKDVLIADGRIAAVGEHILPELQESSPHVELVDGTGKKLMPGLIDSHVHITGGGGEGSFKTRTPELMLSDCTAGGITTVVGVIGTDGTTRTMTNLVAKAKALNEEGITCYCQSGSYQVPVKTLTGSLEKDIILIEEIIGAGEIAISDHRSSQPTKEELARIASDARVGGILSGKAGVVNVHLGDSPDRLRLIEEVVDTTDIPITQFVPTHINRNRELLEAGVSFAKKGGYVDFTTSTTKEILAGDETKCSRGLKYMLAEGVPDNRITFTSDGQGSLPEFDEAGKLKGLRIGRVTSLFKEVRDAVLEEGIAFETAIKVATSNVADAYSLTGKGRVEAGKDADLLLLNRDDLSIDSVMARGKWMMKDREIVTKGTFEE